MEVNKMELEELKKLAQDTVKETIDPLLQEKENEISKMIKRDKETEDKSLIFGRMIRALVNGKGDPERAIYFAKKNWGEDDAVIKALAAGTPEAGGFLVAPEYYESVMTALRATAVVRRMGAVVMPVASGVLNIPTMSGATAAYVGENSDITVQSQTFGQIALTFKKLAALVPISNDLLRYAAYDVDALVRDDIVNAIAEREDLAFIRGDGTNNQPKGIRTWADWVTASAPATEDTDNDNLVWATPAGVDNALTIAEATKDLGRLILLLRANKVKFIRPGWIISPRVEYALSTLRDANGNWAFPEMKQGLLLNYPFAVSEQIPENLTVNSVTDCTEVYLVDFSEALIIDSGTLEVQVSDVATYSSSGTVYSAFSQDQTIIRVIARHDFGMRRKEAAAVLEKVEWGKSGITIS